MSALKHFDPPAASPRNQRILIIDDNAAIHEDVRKILGAPAREERARRDRVDIGIHLSGDVLITLKGGFSSRKS